MKFLCVPMLPYLASSVMLFHDASALAPLQPLLSSQRFAKDTKDAFSSFSGKANGYGEKSPENFMPSVVTGELGAANLKNGGRVVGTTTLAALLSIQILLATAIMPFPAWSADIAHGATLFQANCAGCHAGGQNFMSEKKTLQKEALEKYRSLDQAKIQDFVQNGMPHKFLPMKQPFDDKDYLDVTSYVLDQALGEKW